MERRVEMSSAGCSAIHFHAHKAECFVCSVVNKIKVLFCLFFLLALKASNQHITAASNLFIIERRGVELQAAEQLMMNIVLYKLNLFSLFPNSPTTFHVF